MNAVVKDDKADAKANPNANPEAELKAHSNAEPETGLDAPTKAQAPGAQPRVDLHVLFRQSGLAGVPDEIDRDLGGLAPGRTRIREIAAQRLAGCAPTHRARLREAHRPFADTLGSGASANPADPAALTLLTPPISARAACSPNLSVTRRATPPNPSYPLRRRASCVTQTLR
ncbi:hypothetical protein [Paraburkholderia diazotrophica]|uniref:Uncharacterized protein n=1 Tax=Paraburkholderia diazotrophica TaxID=667676 RepID=A0A1H7D0B2_9BURK|nr:hypothetical protein [Paraburkholderia diazotrophica]SEJ92922.1 hypothetical protein SAMN05192539_102448 [Paraburkholderia diazotrophica]